jgi:hypothetical protein
MLTKVEIYGETAPATTRVKATLRVNGTALEITNVVLGTGSSAPLSFSYNYDTSYAGATWILNSTCPSAYLARSVGYTATATTIVLIDDPQVQTFTAP